MSDDLIKLIKTYSDGMAKVKSQESDLWQNIANQAEAIIRSNLSTNDDEEEREVIIEHGYS